MAARVSDAGFHVLRFDYHGAGDSAGDIEEACLEGWLDDTAAAVAEMREISGSPRVALVGLRLGATLAALAARRGGGVEALVLWDPVLEGAAYVRELRAAHQAWLRAHAAGAAARDGEALGFALPASLAADIGHLRLEGAMAVPRGLVVSCDEGNHAITLSLDGASGAVEYRRFPPAPVWLHAEGMDRALVPSELLNFVAAWLARAYP
jgi:pimeloyl-ACP methyl ester carboxylesterase